MVCSYQLNLFVHAYTTLYKVLVAVMVFILLHFGILHTDVTFS